MRTPADEELLSGGNATVGAVVRVGGTVRKPWQPTTPQVAEFLQHLRERGVDVPAHLGRDAQGRQVIEYIPGDIAMHRGVLEHDLLRRIGAYLRSIHDAAEDFPVPEPPEQWPVLLPAAAPDLICHNDAASWNLVLSGEHGAERIVLIDADGAGPSTRLWDLAYAAISFPLLDAGQDPSLAAARLRAFVDGYDPDRSMSALREGLAPALALRARAMHEHLRAAHESGEEPWATMFVEGHGEHWRMRAEYIETYGIHWERAVRA